MPYVLARREWVRRLSVMKKLFELLQTLFLPRMEDGDYGSWMRCHYT